MLSFLFPFCCSQPNHRIGKLYCQAQKSTILIKKALDLCFFILYGCYITTKERQKMEKEQKQRSNVYLEKKLYELVKKEAIKNSRTIAGQILFYIKQCLGK